MDFKELSESFIRSGIYLRAWSPRTVRTYRQGLRALLSTLPSPLERLKKADLDHFVIALRSRGVGAGGCNMYIRTVNSFLSWLAEEKHLDEHLRIRLLPVPSKPLRGFNDSEIRLLLAFRPKGFLKLRTWTLIQLLLDTGVRIEEALTLRVDQINMDDLRFTVLGKGSRERDVPMSVELRKLIFRYEQMAAKLINRRDVTFCTLTGHRLSYRNTYRDIKTLCKQAGVEGQHVHPHSFRHYFAVTYIRSGGDIYRLSRILGHTSISTTQLYLRSMGVEHLVEGHSQHSPLARLA